MQKAYQDGNWGYYRGYDIGQKRNARQSSSRLRLEAVCALCTSALREQSMFRSLFGTTVGGEEPISTDGRGGSKAPAQQTGRQGQRSQTAKAKGNNKEQQVPGKGGFFGLNPTEVARGESQRHKLLPVGSRVCACVC